MNMGLESESELELLLGLLPFAAAGSRRASTGEGSPGRCVIARIWGLSPYGFFPFS